VELLCNNEIQNGKCPSYQLEHHKTEDLRQMDVFITGIFTASDNLNEQLDVFIGHCKKYLQTFLITYSKTYNVKFKNKFSVALALL